MHITLEADYAVRIVACLANKGERMDAKTISDMTCVTLRFSLKILRKLVASEIVKSFKGTQGGYELAKAPSEITLKEVVQTIEGTYMLNRCLDSCNPCSRGASGACKCQEAFKDISEVVNKKLEGYTFDMFIEK